MYEPFFSICHPFLGDYVRLRQNPQWKKMCCHTNDQYVVFADIINKITRTGGKVSWEDFLLPWTLVSLRASLLNIIEYKDKRGSVDNCHGYCQCVPINRGTVSVSYCETSKCAIVSSSSGGESYTKVCLSCQYTQRLNMNLTAINSSWAKKVHLKPKVRQDYKEIYLPAFNGHFLFQFVPILFVISTSSMLILDQRTMQIKYRWGPSLTGIKYHLIILVLEVPVDKFKLSFELNF